MDPHTSEADRQQLDLARAQGEAYGRALTHMAESVADSGDVREAGGYTVGYAVEEAEGMYGWVGDGLRWQEPDGENLHLEVSVRDRADGRFVPGLRVNATLAASGGDAIGPVELPLLWHPMIYHYGRNLRVPEDQTYTLTVQIDPPTFSRHDEVNGRRFTEPVEVQFRHVELGHGQDRPA
jgi:hypothetical protein